MCDEYAYHSLNTVLILHSLKMKVFSGKGRREFNLVSAGASSRSDPSLSTRKRSREWKYSESSDDDTEECGSSGQALAELARQQNSSRRVKPTLRPGLAPQQKQKQKAVKRAQYEYVSLADTVHHMHKLVNVYAVRICC